MHSLYFSPESISMMQARRIIWIDYVARMGHEKYIYIFWGEALREKSMCENFLRFILKKLCGGVRTAPSGRQLRTW
jgi:hypothetical protein